MSYTEHSDSSIAMLVYQRVDIAECVVFLCQGQASPPPYITLLRGIRLRQWLRRRLVFSALENVFCLCFAFLG